MSSPRPALTGSGFPVTVADNDVIDTVDLGVSSPGALSGTVYVDADNSADRDPGEVGQGGITVILRDAGGDEVARTTTNGNGGYLLRRSRRR